MWYSANKPEPIIKMKAPVLIQSSEPRPAMVFSPAEIPITNMMAPKANRKQAESRCNIFLFTYHLSHMNDVGLSKRTSVTRHSISVSTMDARNKWSQRDFVTMKRRYQQEDTYYLQFLQESTSIL